jgi:hypothetical protein
MFRTGRIARRGGVMFRWMGERRLSPPDAAKGEHSGRVDNFGAF